MKQFITIFCLFCCLALVQNTALAQYKEGLHIRANGYNYVNHSPAWKDWRLVYDEIDGGGVEIGYNRKLDKNTWLLVPAKFGLGRVGSDEYAGTRDQKLINLDAILRQNLTRYGRLLVPNVHLGVGGTWNLDQTEFDLNIPAGLGLSLKLLDNVYLDLVSQYRFSLDNRAGWHHGAGLTLLFGEDKPADRDGDGVSDATDKCPDTPGVATLMGCPDRDADGIADADDACPDVAGPATFQGCPDTDGDGIVDKDDMCPKDKGLAAFKGCPDTDGDGIVDGDDKCPREAGPAANNGCPVRDRDNDGIADADDKCPTEKGTAATGGCPDRDADGVADKDDACPDKKGPASSKGCPDTDGDGLTDDVDRCVDRPGPASNKGCPEIKKEDKAKLERAVKLVQFETGKAVLLQKSYAILDEVVSVMNTYPDYSLNIGGHTDNRGDDKLNQDLSDRRAKTCYDYLVSKGIAATRMASAGYGETQPKADNNTAAGRELNRRVEFELYVK